MKDRIALLLVFARFCKACEFDLWVFDRYQDPPPAFPGDSGTIITDGECRGIGLGSSFDFPGYYRATCSDGVIHFSVSGCDSSCERCGMDPYNPGALYAMNDVVTIPRPSIETMFTRHIFTFGNGLVTINYGAYGVCSQCPSPTASPVTRRPTSVPTRSPVSLQPTNIPTSHPTEGPTKRPTGTPTMVPVSFRPTRPPTRPPTGRPVVAPVSSWPTKKPTHLPTTLPTDTPLSSAPTSSPILTTRPPLNMPLTISIQKPASSTENPGAPTESPRQAATSLISTQVESLAPAAARATDPQDREPQDEPEIASGEPFEKPQANSSLATKSVEKVSKSMSVYIIGYSMAVLGGIAMVAALFAVVCLQRKRRSGGKVEKDSENGDKTTNPSTACSNDIFILVDKSCQDEMSTLGGYTGLKAQDKRDGSVWEDPTVSVDVGYDFDRNAYKASGPNSQTVGSLSADFSNDITLHQFGNVLFNDETSFEHQFSGNNGSQPRTNEAFDIVVPPGIVGIVVDSAVGGLPPVVRSLGVNSVLKEKVKVGDRLLSVTDSESTHDVRHMSARAVSNIISKASKHKRTLRFARNDKE